MNAIAELLNRKYIRWLSFEMYIRAHHYFRSQNGDCTLYSCNTHTSRLILMFDSTHIVYGSLLMTEFFLTSLGKHQIQFEYGTYVDVENMVKCDVFC